MKKVKYSLCSQLVPKYPSLHEQINVSALMSMHVPPLSQGELLQASVGTKTKRYTDQIHSQFCFSNKVAVNKS